MKKRETGWKALRAFLPYYKAYLPIVCLDLLCALLSTVCELVFPMIVRQITNTALTGQMEVLLAAVIRLSAVYLFLRLMDTAANYYMAYIGHVMGASLEADMRHDLFARLLKLPFSFYDTAKVGEIMSRVTNDLFDITEFSHHCPEEFFIAGVKIIGSFVILSGINLPLTVILFLLLPLMLFSVIFFRRKMKLGFTRSRERTAELNAGLEDSLQGIRVVQSFAREGVEQEKFDRNNRDFLSVKRYAYRYMALFQAGTRFFDGVLYIAVILIGSLFVIGGHITPADLIAFLLYIQTLIASVRKIVEFTEQFQRGTTGIERFYALMQQPIAIADAPQAKPLSVVEGQVTFRNVSFSYGNEEEVLSHLELTVKSGENVAIVGPSGSGKTTLCHLIPRFYDTTNGDVLIDGTPVREITLHSLRENIGLVQQDVYLFGGTVAENIAYGNPSATPEELRAAARAAGADEFIEKLPQGYDTEVGERGVRLSGGQKQRISIARLFLKNPPILILDEATSALDNESEFLVQQSLRRLAKGRTTFTIAHRLSTIRHADRILVLTERGIEEAGTHQELLEQNGIYAGLYRRTEEMA